MCIRENSRFCDSVNYVEGVTRLVKEVTKGLPGADFIYVFDKDKVRILLTCYNKIEEGQISFGEVKVDNLGLVTLG